MSFTKHLYLVDLSGDLVSLVTLPLCVGIIRLPNTFTSIHVLNFLIIRMSEYFYVQGCASETGGQVYCSLMTIKTGFSKPIWYHE